MKKEWRPIPGYPGYEASSDGDIRRSNLVLTQYSDQKGYRRLKLSIDGRRVTRLTAPLVAAAFCGPKPEGEVVRHKNGDQRDNRASNLEYGTRSENERDKRRHGTAPIGQNHPAAKLTEKQVATIRERLQRGSRANGRNALAREFGVSHRLITLIVTRRLWGGI